MHHLPEHLCQGTCVGVRLRAEAFSRLVLACRGLGKFILLLLLPDAPPETHREASPITTRRTTRNLTNHTKPDTQPDNHMKPDDPTHQ